MAGFKDLGLGEDLCGALESSGYRSPYAFQVEAIPVLLRGTTAMSVASSGSGKTLAYATALLERLDPAAAATQALVLRPTDDASFATALLLHRLGLPRDVVVTVLRRDRLEETGRAQVVVSTPAAALEAIGGSHLKLDACRTFVVDGLSDIIEWGSAPALDSIASLVPKEAQRAVFTTGFSAEVGDWVERHARRARPLGAGSGRGGVASAAGIGAAAEKARELAADLVVD
ncbi:MAG: DEAD/DEAH box helicase, partial [Gemmatimonadota bacterium]